MRHRMLRLALATVGVFSAFAFVQQWQAERSLADAAAHFASQLLRESSAQTRYDRLAEVVSASDVIVAAAYLGDDGSILDVWPTTASIRQSAREAVAANTVQGAARLTIANACAAADIVAIDTPTAEFKDAERLRRDLETAKGMGYRGKFCIHPTQVQVANRVFAPSADDLAWANRVVEAYEEGKRQGLGAVALDGAMIDDPVADRAYNILEWTRQIEQREAVLKS
ncbi:MAG: hypothetical protein IIB55_05250 [Planctomycetes bacterium]|nr:hypothetical protein [Planctomycetota bacterium]